MPTCPSTESSQNAIAAYRWEPQPAADRFARQQVDEFLRRNPFAADLARRMRDETGTRFFDWVESVRVSASLRGDVLAAGFVPTESDVPDVFTHPGGMFPTFLLLPDSGRQVVSIRVESIADFATACRLPLLTEDNPLSPYRRMRVSMGDGTELWAVERHGYCGFRKYDTSDSYKIKQLHYLERFRARRREFSDDTEGFAQTHQFLGQAISDLGRDVTCELFFYAEREYWQSRNHAAQVQKVRQDRLGLGWANHDHHTYRSSRRTLPG